MHAQRDVSLLLAAYKEVVLRFEAVAAAISAGPLASSARSASSQHPPSLTQLPATPAAQHSPQVYEQGEMPPAVRPPVLQPPRLQQPAAAQTSWPMQSPTNQMPPAVFLPAVLPAQQPPTNQGPPAVLLPAVLPTQQPPTNQGLEVPVAAVMPLELPLSPAAEGGVEAGQDSPLTGPSIRESPQVSCAHERHHLESTGPDF